MAETGMPQMSIPKGQRGNKGTSFSFNIDRAMPMLMFATAVGMLIISALQTHKFFMELGLSGLLLLGISVLAQVLFFIFEHELLARRLDGIGAFIGVVFVLLDMITTIGGLWLNLQLVSHTSVVQMMYNVFGEFASPGQLIGGFSFLVGAVLSITPDMLFNQLRGK